MLNILCKHLDDVGFFAGSSSQKHENILSELQRFRVANLNLNTEKLSLVANLNLNPEKLGFWNGRWCIWGTGVQHKELVQLKNW